MKGIIKLYFLTYVKILDIINIIPQIFKGLKSNLLTKRVQGTLTLEKS